MKVKICGITNIDDAKAACLSGADLIGLVFVEGTPRALDAGEAGKITSSLKCDVVKVGLFQNEDIGRVIDTVAFCGIDHVQLHGVESPEYCEQLKVRMKTDKGIDLKIIKVFKVGKKVMPNNGYYPDDYEHVDYFMFDTYRIDLPGGTGEKFNWDLLREVKDSLRKPFFLAGGLTPENVKEAIASSSPYGVDTSSGVEAEKGRKDHKKLKEFIENAKKV